MASPYPGHLCHWRTELPEVPGTGDQCPTEPTEVLWKVIRTRGIYPPGTVCEYPTEHHLGIFFIIFSYLFRDVTISSFWGLPYKSNKHGPRGVWLLSLLRVLHVRDRKEYLPVRGRASQHII